LCCGRLAVVEERDRLQLLSENDPLLHPLIQAGDDAQRELAIESLMVLAAKPVIATVLARNRTSALRAEDLEDVAATVALRLVRRLQLVPFDSRKAIARFPDFVASLTYNGVYDVLRRRFPERSRLKNRMRYVMSRDERFAVWTHERGTAAGLQSWRGRQDLSSGAIPKQQADAAMLTRDDTAGALHAILVLIAKPILLDDLTAIVADLWNVTDAIPSDAPELVAASTPLRDLETRQQMSALWREIESLPPRQRAALLLNLRDADGLNAVALFVLAGIAPFAQIAASLEMTTERLTALWNDLPLSDLAIGEMLGLARQQIINLRKSARERLARRMRK
jgi:hypothetical protein